MRNFVVIDSCMDFRILVNLLSKILSCKKMDWCEWDKSFLLVLVDKISSIPILLSSMDMAFSDGFVHE